MIAGDPSKLIMNSSDLSNGLVTWLTAFLYLKTVSASKSWESVLLSADAISGRAEQLRLNPIAYKYSIVVISFAIHASKSRNKY